MLTLINVIFTGPGKPETLNNFSASAPSYKVDETFCFDNLNM